MISMNQGLTLVLFFSILVVILIAIRLVRISRAAEYRMDMVRQEEMRQQLRDEARRDEMLHSILQGMGDACLIAGPDLIVLFANDAAQRLLARAITPVGRRLYAVLADPLLVGAAERCAREQQPLKEEHPVVLGPVGGERERYVVIDAAPVTLPGIATGPCLRVTLIDETERRDTEQIRKDFVANASHELRTPLAIINGYLENLTEGLIDDPAIRQRSLVTMQKHSHRLARIVEDMLTLSRFESNSAHDAATMKRTPFGIQECVQEVVDRLHLVIAEKQASVVLDFLPAEAALHGDRYYWEQVFFNLIENALKQNLHPGLQITVSLRQSETEGLEIIVRDNGIGIPRADLPFIFKRFYRVAKHHGQEVKGTGLGLSIVRRAIEAHGGTVSVESTPGERTDFIIKLPSGMP
jgi:two-component system, OmpR family, phosphate regulon sensor histidine kinase PhoR